MLELAKIFFEIKEHISITDVIKVIYINPKLASEIEIETGLKRESYDYLFKYRGIDIFINYDLVDDYSSDVIREYRDDVFLVDIKEMRGQTSFKV